MNSSESVVQDSRPTKRLRTCDCLTERRASEILSVVSAPLRGRIRLVSTGKELRDLEVIHTYDWLEIDVVNPQDQPGPPIANALEWIDTAGKICAIWHLLACCPGFRAHENGPFWKHLVSEREENWMEHRDDPSDEEVDDMADWLDSVVATFVGYVRYITRNEELASYRNSRVEIGVRLVKNFPLEDLGYVVCDVYNSMAKLDTPTAKTSAKKKAHFPRSKLTSFVVDGRDRWTDLPELADILHRCPIQVLEFKSTFGNHVETSELRKLLRAASGVKAAGTLCHVSINLDDATSDQIDTLFSLLPCVPVRTLRLSASRDRITDPVTGLGDLTWLAYTLFHAWSTWSLLDLERLDLILPTAAPLASVYNAQAALYLMVHGREDETATEASSGHCAFVRMRPKTKCYDSRTLAGEVLGAFNVEVEETAVIQAGIDHLDGLPDAVCVVARGDGFRWVSRDGVVAL